MTQGCLYPAALLVAGLMWGIHPLRVESVAWVTERKDVLNGLFTLSSTLIYLYYVRKREDGKPCAAAYLWSLLLFACSLMAKSVSVVLPVMLLVLDWYPLDRLRKERLGLLLEKVPFLLLSGVMAVVTVMQMSGNIYSFDTFPMSNRILVSGAAVFHYCRLLLLPVGIIPQYPLPPSLPVFYAVATAAVALVFGFCFATAKSRPWITASSLCFLLPLLPTLSFFPVGDQVMAARFTYLPSVAVSILAAWAFVTVATNYAGIWPRRVLFASVTLLLLFYAGMSWKLIGVWKDTGTYWSRMIELKPIGRAYSDRGRFYLETGRYAEAVDDLARATEIASQVGLPDIFNLYAIRGEALAKMGRHEEAVRDFSSAISLFPSPIYYYHRSQSLKALGRTDDARQDLLRGVPDPGPIRWYQAE